MFFGWALGAVVIHYSISAALGLARVSPPCAVLRCLAHCARTISCDSETRLYVVYHMPLGSSSLIGARRSSKTRRELLPR